MNEFVEQFLIEARDLVEQATGDLLALEEQPDDRERLDSAFRAIHTLKGAAGIVEFAAMGRVMHAAEDVLSRLRSGSDSVTPVLIGDCLSCLDQIVQWLDAVQADGEAPAAAEAEADALLARFNRASGQVEFAVDPPPSDAWIDDVQARHPVAGSEARCAIRFTPDPECFFNGEDPFARIAAVPGLLVLDILGREEWPPLDSFDVFQCQMIIVALARCTAEEAAAALGSVQHQADIKNLQKSASVAIDLSSAERGLIEAQIRLLAETISDGFAGRLASAAAVVANILRLSRRAADAAQIQRLLTRCLAETDPRPLITALDDILLARPLVPSPEVPAEGPTPPKPEARETVTRVRVNVDRIDKLMKLSGELIVVKNGLAHVAGLVEAGAEPKTVASLLKDQHALLDRLLRQMHGVVLNLRVLPLRYVFQRFPKLVREMAESVGKSARLVIEGDQTEADKAIVEALFEPLLHVLRNAVDHGLESAQDRVTLGKPTTATIHLRARRQAESLVIELEDDGRGVNVERVKAVAFERGIASAEALAAMNKDELVELIFAPGFSTSAAVSGLSGRGVGMDAVRAAMSRLGGKVTITSAEHQGTLVRFILPFSVMMTRIMTVEAAGQRFGLSLDTVIETLSLGRDKIMPLGTASAFVLRDRTIPLLALADYLDAPSATPVSPTLNIVVVLINGEWIGLEVDRICDRMEIMLQPKEGLISEMRGIAGTTLLGDGRVLLILDLEDLLR